jgi:hypothetical protein
MVTKPELLIAVIVLTAGALVAIITLALHGTPEMQALINTIISFVGPTIAILIAMMRVDAVTTSQTAKIDAVQGDVTNVQDDVGKISNGVEVVHKLVNSMHDKLLAEKAVAEQERDAANARVRDLQRKLNEPIDKVNESTVEDVPPAEDVK